MPTLALKPGAPVLREITLDALESRHVAEGRQRVGHQIGTIRELTAQLASGNPSVWAVGLAGHLPKERLARVVADVRDTGPESCYPKARLWSFVEIWIARRQELQPNTKLAGRDYGP